MKRTTVDRFMSSSDVSYIDLVVFWSGNATNTAAGWAYMFRDGGERGEKNSLGPTEGSTYRSTIKERTPSILGDLSVLLGFYMERE